MPTPFQLILGVAVLIGLGVLYLFARRVVKAWLTYRGTRIVVCPETRETAAVRVDAGHAAWSAPQGRAELRLESCNRWPERLGCGRECLGQVESDPESCLLQRILADWYRDKPCAFCGRRFAELQWHDHTPALLAADGTLVEWTSFAPETVGDVLARHKPVCWDCRIAEGFRREHAGLVTERPPRLGPPPSMA